MVDITLVLDKSGSMASIRDDTVGGVNTFLARQQGEPGEARLTLIQFDHEYQVMVNNQPLAHVMPLDHLTYQPRGSTALLDAIGRALREATERLALTTDRGLLVIVTDGYNNASREFTKPQVNLAIDAWRSLGHEVIFLGANQDAIHEGAAMGIPMDMSMTYSATTACVNHTYAAMHRSASAFRMGDVQAMSFTAEERLQAERPGEKA